MRSTTAGACWSSIDWHNCRYLPHSGGFESKENSWKAIAQVAPAVRARHGARGVVVAGFVARRSVTVGRSHHRNRGGHRPAINMRSTSGGKHDDDQTQ